MDDTLGSSVLQARTRLALELVADPAVDLFKRVCLDRLDARADAELRRRSLAMLRHCWSVVYRAYGIRHGREFYAVHRSGDRLNCLELTCDEERARGVAQWWAGPPVDVSWVSSVEVMPEAWIALGVALHWSPPEWL